jgi:hypothetical protein
MEMFLLILFTSLPVLVLCCLMVYRVRPGNAEEKAPEIVRERTEAATASRFFAGGQSATLIPSAYPIEMMLSQIERHVRLEQAAAESFLDLPTRESLRTRTASPFLN